MAADSIDAYVVWQVELENGWTDLAPDLSKNVEEAQLCGSIPYTYGRFSYSIFKSTQDTAVQTNDATRTQRNLRRVQRRYPCERVWKEWKPNQKEWVDVANEWHAAIESVPPDSTQVVTIQHSTYSVTRTGAATAILKNVDIGGTRERIFQCVKCVVVWRWRENDGSWNDYALTVSQRIYRLDGQNAKLKHKHGQHEYLIRRFCFDEGIQYNLKTSFSRDIHRQRRALEVLCPPVGSADDTKSDEHAGQAFVWEWGDDSLPPMGGLLAFLAGPPPPGGGAVEWKAYDDATCHFINELSLNEWTTIDIPGTEEQNRYEITRTNDDCGLQRNTVSGRLRNIRGIWKDRTTVRFDDIDFSAPHLLHFYQDAELERVIVDNDLSKMVVKRWVRCARKESKFIDLMMSDSVIALLIEYSLGMCWARCSFRYERVLSRLHDEMMFHELPNKTLDVHFPNLTLLNQSFQLGIISLLTHHHLEGMDSRWVQKVRSISALDLSEHESRFGLKGMEFVGSLLYAMNHGAPRTAQVTIQTLSLTYNEIDLKCMVYFRNVVTDFDVFSKIRCIDLSGNPIGDDGVRCLVDICCHAPGNCADYVDANPYLRQLGVVDCGLTDEGVLHLVECLVRDDFMERIDFGELGEDVDDDDEDAASVERAPCPITPRSMQDMNRALQRVRRGRYVRAYYHSRKAADQNALFAGETPDSKWRWVTEEPDADADSGRRRESRDHNVRRR